MINTQIEKFYNMVEHFSESNVTSEEKMLQFEVITEKYVEMLKNNGIDVEVTENPIILIDNQAKLLDNYKFSNLQELKTYFLHLQNVKKTYVKTFGYANYVSGVCPILRCYDVLKEQTAQVPSNIETVTSKEESDKIEEYANTLLTKEHKITLEELVEILVSFKKGMENSGITFSIKEESDRYTLVVSKEMVNDLLTLHK